MIKKIFLPVIIIIFLFACKNSTNPTKNTTNPIDDVNLTNAKDLTLGNIFYYREYRDFPHGYTYQMYEVIGDTILNEVNYAILRESFFDANKNSYGNVLYVYQRSDERKLYRWNHGESIIFDLDWMIGEKSVTSKGDTAFFGMNVDYIIIGSTFSIPEWQQWGFTVYVYEQHFGLTKFQERVITGGSETLWALDLIGCQLQGKVFGKTIQQF